MLAFFKNATPVGVTSCSGIPTRPVAPSGTCDLEPVSTQLYAFSLLNAFTVVPRAPYFCALRRVSSNAERA